MNIQILNNDLSIYGIVTGFTSLDFTRALNSQGSFKISIDFNNKTAKYLAKDKIVYIDDDKIGYIDKITISQESDNLYSLFVVEGVELKDRLDRLIYPQSGQATDKYTNEYLETVVKSLILKNAGSSASSDRQIPNLVLAADQNRGTLINYSARYKELSKEIYSLLASQNMGLKCTIDFENEKTIFDVCQGNDLTPTLGIAGGIALSLDANTALAVVDTDDALNYKNLSVTAGQGEGASRTILEVGTSDTGYARRETFTDARDIADDDELANRGAQKLTAQQKSRGVSVRYNPQGSYKVGEDFDLGDFISTDVNIDGDAPLLYDGQIVKIKYNFNTLAVSTVDLVIDYDVDDSLIFAVSASRMNYNSLVATENSGGGTPTAPIISLFLPPNGATEISTTPTVKINFNQSVIGDTGKVQLYRGDGEWSLVQEWTASSLTIVGGEVTVPLGEALTSEFLYSFLIEADAFKNVFAMYYTGILTHGAWQFTVEAIPSLTTSNPVDNATNVIISKNPTITFNTTMFGDIGYVYLKKGDGTIVDSWQGSSLASGATISLTTSGDMEYNNGYYINIDSNAFKNINDTYFPGISDSTTLNFTTELEMLASTLFPDDEATGVARNISPYIDFNQNVYSDSGAVYLRKSDGTLITKYTTAGIDTDVAWSISGNRVTFPSQGDIDYLEDCYITVDSDAFKSLNGKYFAGYASATDWNFTIQSTAYTAPMIQYFVIPSSTGAVRHKVEMPVDADGVMIRYKINAWTTGDVETDGTLVATITDDSSYKNDNEWYEATGLTNNTRYYFKAFPYRGGVYNTIIGDNESNCSAGGLIHEYTGDSISGSAIYDTAGAATTYNATASNITYDVGKIGNAMVFNDSTSYASVNDAYPDFCSSDFSVSFWIKPNASGRVISLYKGSATAINIKSTYEVEFLLSGSVKVTSIESLSTSVWTHVIITRSTTAGVAIYFNNVAKGTGTYTGSDGALDYSNWIGADPIGEGRYYFGGSVEQMRFSNKVLSSYDRTALYNGGDGC